jgi:hypothetical protein
MSKRQEDYEHIDEQVTTLCDGMVDLSWELERMSSSGEETYKKMRKALVILIRLIDERREVHK